MELIIVAHLRPITINIQFHWSVLFCLIEIFRVHLFDVLLVLKLSGLPVRNLDLSG